MAMLGVVPNPSGDPEIYNCVSLSEIRNGSVHVFTASDDIFYLNVQNAQNANKSPAWLCYPVIRLDQIEGKLDERSAQILLKSRVIAGSLLSSSSGITSSGIFFDSRFGMIGTYLPIWATVEEGGGLVFHKDKDGLKKSTDFLPEHGSYLSAELNEDIAPVSAATMEQRLREREILIMERIGQGSDFLGSHEMDPTASDGLQIVSSAGNCHEHK